MIFNTQVPSLILVSLKGKYDLQCARSLQMPEASFPLLCPRSTELKDKKVIRSRV